MDSRLIIDTERLKEIKKRFEDRIEKVNEKFDKMDKIMYDIDGENELWRGKTAKMVTEKYAQFSSNFPNIVEKLNNYDNYLQFVIDNYTKAEGVINNSIDKNESDLNVE